MRIRISDHFYRDEFACKCGCGFDIVDAELVYALESMRIMFGGRPIIINSGCRCENHNASVGGTKGSYHLKGQAADIVISDIYAGFIADCLEDQHPNTYGIGRYTGRTHIDVRQQMARWSGK